jgi:hypothetical protein
MRGSEKWVSGRECRSELSKNGGMENESEPLDSIGTRGTFSTPQIFTFLWLEKLPLSY